MNKTRKQIKQLLAKIRPLENKIYELERDEILNVQLPRLTKMVGYCLRSTYESEKYLIYGRILDLVKEKDNSPQFILEVCQITEQGNPSISLNNIPPYTNKEWWDAEVPISGWEKCSEDEYQTFKAKILGELDSQKSLRNWIKKLEY